MAKSQLQLIELYQEALHSVVASPENWLKFLESAGRNYRYPFQDQLMIHHQKPDAIAVLELNQWNQRFGRWVNRGATGIAAFGRSQGRTYVKYYFDVTDTRPGRNAIPVPLWSVEPDDHGPILSVLEQKFDTTAPIVQVAVFEAAQNYTSATISAKWDDLQSAELPVSQEQFQSLLENSIAYLLLHRLDMMDYGSFYPQDFDALEAFQTPEQLNLLGDMVSIISEGILVDIAATVRAVRRNGPEFFARSQNAVYYEDIEPNVGSADGQAYTSYDDGSASSASYWMLELDATQRELIKTVLAFGYPEVDYGYGQQAQYAATQVILWEIIMRHRYPDLSATSHAGLYNSVYSILGTTFADSYSAILNGLSIYDGKYPSFASDDGGNIPTVKLTLNKSTNCYEGTVTDTNAVLSRYTFAKDGVTFTKNGNKLTISVPASSASAVKGKVVTGTSTMKNMDTSNPLIWENSSYQTVCTAGGAKPAEAYFKLDWDSTGGIKIIKKVSDSSVTLKGWTFYFKNNSTGETITKTTDANGNITVTGLEAGAKYTVSEKTYDGYYQVPSQTVTIESGKTTELTFTNKPLVGNLTVTKSVNNGTLKGFQFRLYGTSTIGKAVDVTATTNSSGVASFKNIYVGTYTLEEVAPGDQYIKPASQTVTIKANSSTGVGSTASATMINTWKQWRTTITKVDGETTTAQGNASLDGAEYTLYKDGTAVKTYTIKNGSFTTDYYPCTDSNSVYTLKETKAPTGYTLDSTVYKLTTSYNDYNKAQNSFSLTVKDTVIKGKIQVEKYAHNTVSGEKTPEKGTTFQVWLKSAGSYAKAKSSEKDVITIGENGKGISKSLPYGTYCVKQVSGWDGYIKDEATYEVAVASNGTTVVKDTSGKKLVIYNEIWTGSLAILKVDGDTKTPLADAEFTLKGSDGSEVMATTGSDGKCTFSGLVYGVTYTWSETKAPKGYLLNEDNTGTLKVDKDNATLEVTCEDFRREAEIVVTKVNGGGDPLPGCTYLLEYKENGTWAPVSKRVDSSVTAGGCTSPNLKNGCLTTDETGVASFTGLLADGFIQYRLTEVKAPEGYSLLLEPVFEGTLPVAVKTNLASDGADEIIGDTAYFYRLPVTVCDGHIYVLPQTGGSGNIFLPLGLMAMFTAGLMCLFNNHNSKKKKENA